MLLLTLIAAMTFDPVAGASASSALGPMTVRSAGVEPRSMPRPPGPVTRTPARNCGAARVQPVSGLLRQELSAPEDGKVRMYHLLSLEVAGCSIPVIARDSIPDADRAIGRQVH